MHASPLFSLYVILFNNARNAQQVRSPIILSGISMERYRARWPVQIYRWDEAIEGRSATGRVDLLRD